MLYYQPFVYSRQASRVENPHVPSDEGVVETGHGDLNCATEPMLLGRRALVEVLNLNGMWTHALTIIVKLDI